MSPSQDAFLSAHFFPVSFVSLLFSSCEVTLSSTAPSEQIWYPVRSICCLTTVQGFFSSHSISSLSQTLGTRTKSLLKCWKKPQVISEMYHENFRNIVLSFCLSLFAFAKEHHVMNHAHDFSNNLQKWHPFGPCFQLREPFVNARSGQNAFF